MADITCRVFISATSPDLASFRQAAHKHLLANDIFPVVQETFPTDHREIEEILESLIARSDAVVCLIGLAYGQEADERPANGVRRSYTQMEYDIARRLGKPVYLFVASEDCPFDSVPEEGPEKQQLQAKHRETILRGKKIWYRFRSQEDLCKQLGTIPFPRSAPLSALSSTDRLLTMVGQACQIVAEPVRRHYPQFKRWTSENAGGIVVVLGLIAAGIGYYYWTKKPPYQEPAYWQYVRQGRESLKNQDYSGALTLLRKAETMSGQSFAYEVPLAQGQEHFHQRNWDKALESFTQTLRENYKCADAYYWRARTHSSKEEVRFAINDYTEALNLYKAPIYYLERGSALRVVKDYKGALSDWTSCLQGNFNSNNPDHVKFVKRNAYIARAETYLEIKEYPLAEAECVKLWELSPNEPSGHLLIGHAAMGLKQYDRALSSFNQAGQDVRFAAAAHQMSAKVHLLKDEVEAALARYEKALNIDEKNIANDYAWLLATCPNDRFRNGKTAIDYASRANTAFKGSVPGILDTLAAAHAEAGDFKNAVDWQDKAIQAAQARNRVEVVKDMRSRLELYRAQKPYRESIIR
jgi:tetratricopeptide (TPR) repeat protein